MKYKSYKNNFSGDNKIYSYKDLLDMTLKDLVSFNKEIVSQNRQIGIPSPDELSSSGNVIWVDEYTKDDGTKVSGHWRSKPDSNFEKPLNGRVSSDYGYRKAPIEGASSGHSGVDIAVPVGTSVKTIATGKVVAARNGMKGYGTGVFIDHGVINGKRVVSEYGHLSEFQVKVGDTVTKGQEIAKSGNTGVSTGPHLHITIREDGVPVDPKKYIPDL